MTSVDFLIKEFPDGRLMLLIVFRDGKNFRVHRKGNTTYYTWCAHEDDLYMALKAYEAVNRFNSTFKKKLDEKQVFEKNSKLKPFYIL